MAQQNPIINIERRNARGSVLSDLYHFLMARQWFHLLGLIAAVYLGANLVFAVLYRLGGATITGAHSFRDYFFFSVQTLSTIGYGTMVPATVYAHVLVTTQAFAGTLFVALTTGLVFSKFSRPTSRVLWSKNAVVVTRDGKRRLMFRLANERSNQIVEARLRVSVLRTEKTSDGEILRRFYDLSLERQSTIIFVQTWTAIHVIDEQSALDGLSHDDLVDENVFIVCSMIGLDETFAQQVHSRHVYRAGDIVYDQRFADILGQSADGKRYVDYARFDDLVPMGTRSDDSFKR